MQNRLSDINRLINSVTINFIKLPNKYNTEKLILSLVTANESDFYDIDIMTTYLLKIIYDENSNLFDYSLKNYLQLLFCKNFKNIIQVRTENIQLAVNNIDAQIDATSNIFNLI